MTDACLALADDAGLNRDALDRRIEENLLASYARAAATVAAFLVTDDEF